MQGDDDAGKELATVLRGDGDAGKYREIGVKIGWEICQCK